MVYYIKRQIVIGTGNGAVEPVMSLASGEVKKNVSVKLAVMYVQPIVEDPVADESVGKVADEREGDPP